jgi:hypothetical protein
VSIAGVGLTDVVAYDDYDDDADGDILLRSRSKRVGSVSEILDVSKQKEAPYRPMRFLNPHQEGNVAADLPVQWTLLDARREG